VPRELHHAVREPAAARGAQRKVNVVQRKVNVVHAMFAWSARRVVGTLRAAAQRPCTGDRHTAAAAATCPVVRKEGRDVSSWYGREGGGGGGGGGARPVEELVEGVGRRRLAVAAVGGVHAHARAALHLEREREMCVRFVRGGGDMCVRIVPEGGGGGAPRSGPPTPCTRPCQPGARRASAPQAETRGGAGGARRLEKGRRVAHNVEGRGKTPREGLERVADAALPVLPAAIEEYAPPAVRLRGGVVHVVVRRPAHQPARAASRQRAEGARRPCTTCAMCSISRHFKIQNGRSKSRTGVQNPERAFKIQNGLSKSRTGCVPPGRGRR